MVELTEDFIEDDGDKSAFPNNRHAVSLEEEARRTERGDLGGERVKGAEKVERR